MAGGCSLFEKKDKMEVKGIYIVFRMCACEGIGALGYSLNKESLLRRIFGGKFGGNNCRYRKNLQ